MHTDIKNKLIKKSYDIAKVNYLSKFLLQTHHSRTSSKSISYHTPQVPRRSAELCCRDEGVWKEQNNESLAGTLQLPSYDICGCVLASEDGGHSPTETFFLAELNLPCIACLEEYNTSSDKDFIGKG